MVGMMLQPQMVKVADQTLATRQQSVGRGTQMSGLGCSLLAETATSILMIQP